MIYLFFSIYKKMCCIYVIVHELFVLYSKMISYTVKIIMIYLFFRFYCNIKMLVWDIFIQINTLNGLGYMWSYNS